MALNVELLESSFTQIKDREVTDLHVALARYKIAVKGFKTAPDCSQVICSWNGGQRRFNVYFFEDDIQGQRAISCVDLGYTASTIESLPSPRTQNYPRSPRFGSGLAAQQSKMVVEKLNILTSDR